MTQPDFTYTDDGMFVTILPESEAGVRAWGALAAGSETGNGRFWSFHLASIRASLNASGYTMRKAKPGKYHMSDDELFAALTA